LKIYHLATLVAMLFCRNLFPITLQTTVFRRAVKAAMTLQDIFDHNIFIIGSLYHPGGAFNRETIYTAISGLWMAVTRTTRVDYVNELNVAILFKPCKLHRLFLRFFLEVQEVCLQMLAENSSPTFGNK
jgi:hypothetical protein